MGASDFISSLPEDPRVIKAYDDTGFRIREEKYEGAIIIFGEQVISWEGVKTACDITESSLDIFLKAKQKPELILIGCGSAYTIPSIELRNRLKKEHILLEWMNSRSALSTWPILLADGRFVAGCFLPVNV